MEKFTEQGERVPTGSAREREANVTRYVGSSREPIDGIHVSGGRHSVRCQHNRIRWAIRAAVSTCGVTVVGSDIRSTIGAILSEGKKEWKSAYLPCLSDWGCR